jgi:UDP-GlcNAc:undecaprenyl-phosphate GlcNAc-1-phosphate transferase
MASVTAPLSATQASVTFTAVLLGLALTAALALVFSLAVVRICRRLGLFDRPEPRRVHDRPTPRLGGIAIFLAFTLAALLLYHPANDYERHVFVGLLAAAVLIVAVMAIDDLVGLPPLLRLGVQILAALLAIFPFGHGTLIEVLHNPFVAGNHQTALPLLLAVPFTCFWIVGMMNTINWVDGLDGLAGGIVAITALVMAAISWLLGQHTTAVLCAILAGATLGFLPLNLHPARLFMGDCGAMFLGLALAVLANVGGAKLATMLLLLGLPIADAARVIVRRIRRGRSPLRFDRSHLHHWLLEGGLRQRQIVLLFYAVTALFGGVTLLAAYLQTVAGAWRTAVHPLPWLSVAVDELPLLLGLALLAGGVPLIWRVASRRRRQRGISSSVSWPAARIPPVSGGEAPHVVPPVPRSGAPTQPTHRTGSGEEITRPIPGRLCRHASTSGTRSEA